jgi:hypothetical protein
MTPVSISLLTVCDLEELDQHCACGVTRSYCRSSIRTGPTRRHSWPSTLTSCLELLQGLVAGREPGLNGALASGAGAILGAIAAALIGRRAQQKSELSRFDGLPVSGSHKWLSPGRCQSLEFGDDGEPSKGPLRPWYELVPPSARPFPTSMREQGESHSTLARSKDWRQGDDHKNGQDPEQDGPDDAARHGSSLRSL